MGVLSMNTAHVGRGALADQRTAGIILQEHTRGKFWRALGAFQFWGGFWVSYDGPHPNPPPYKPRGREKNVPARGHALFLPPGFRGGLRGGITSLSQN